MTTFNLRTVAIAGSVSFAMTALGACASKPEPVVVPATLAGQTYTAATQQAEDTEKAVERAQRAVDANERRVRNARRDIDRARSALDRSSNGLVDAQRDLATAQAAHEARLAVVEEARIAMQARGARQD